MNTSFLIAACFWLSLSSFIDGSLIAKSLERPTFWKTRCWIKLVLTCKIGLSRKEHPEEAMIILDEFLPDMCW